VVELIKIDNCVIYFNNYCKSVEDTNSQFNQSAEDSPFRRRRKPLKLIYLHTLVRYIATLKRNEFALHLATREKAARLADKVILIN